MHFHCDIYWRRLTHDQNHGNAAAHFSKPVDACSSLWGIFSILMPGQFLSLSGPPGTECPGFFPAFPKRSLKSSGSSIRTETSQQPPPPHTARPRVRRRFSTPNIWTPIAAAPAVRPQKMSPARALREKNVPVNGCFPERALTRSPQIKIPVWTHRAALAQRGPMAEAERNEEINKYGDTCGILTVKNSNKNKWE